MFRFFGTKWVVPNVLFLAIQRVSCIMQDESAEEAGITDEEG